MHRINLNHAQDAEMMKTIVHDQSRDRLSFAFATIHQLYGVGCPVGWLVRFVKNVKVNTALILFCDDYAEDDFKAMALMAILFGSVPECLYDGSEQRDKQDNSMCRK
jgi:hypothetical protein